MKAQIIVNKNGPRNIVFDNCKINERKTFNVDDAWNLTIKNSTIKTNPIDISNCPRLILDNSTAVNLILKDNSRAYVFGDGNNGNQSYEKDVSSMITFSTPEVYPSYRPPFLVDIEDTDLAVAMDENIKAKLYPNPATTHFTVDLSSITKADLKLFDLTGKMVMSKTNVTGQIMIPVNTLENGIYILNVKTESGSYMQKILIIPEL